MVTRFEKVSMEIQPCIVTTCSCIRGIAAYPPPKVNVLRYNEAKKAFSAHIFYSFVFLPFPALLIILHDFCTSQSVLLVRSRTITLFFFKITHYRYVCQLKFWNASGISESRTNIRFCCTFIKKDAILETVKACLIL